MNHRISQELLCYNQTVLIASCTIVIAWIDSALSSCCWGEGASYKKELDWCLLKDNRLVL